MKKLNYILFLITFLTFFGVADSYGQCRNFTKKKCMPSLKPYIHNGQMNNIMLFPGENAQLKQTFFSGQDYRILVCSQENSVANAYFEIRTETDELVYSSEDAANNFWDFNVEETQNLKINVVIPEDESYDGLESNGCVSVLVGFIHE